MRAHCVPFFVCMCVCVSNELWIERKSERSLANIDDGNSGEKKNEGRKQPVDAREREGEREFFLL